MKKLVILTTILLLIIFLSIFILTPGVKASDSGIKKDYEQWELVRTIPENEYIGDPQEYQLFMTYAPQKLTLKDMKGNALWTKTHLYAYEWFEFEENEVLVSDSYFPDELIYDTMGLGTNKLLDRKGNCLLRDKSNNRFVFVDKKGNEVYLPSNITNWNYYGLYYDKYLVFSQTDYYRYKTIPGDSHYSHDNPESDLTTEDKDVNNLCRIFDKKGTLVNQFKLPDLGSPWEYMMYFDKNMNYLAYEYRYQDIETEKEAEGYVLMKTTGEVIKTENHESSPVEVYYPAFSDDSSLWIPTADGTHDFEILDTETGEKVFKLDDRYVSVCQAAITNKAAGCVIYTSNGPHQVQVLDYKNHNRLFYQENENAECINPWISGDGKEIRFTYRKDAEEPGEVRFYRMK